MRRSSSTRPTIRSSPISTPIGQASGVPGAAVLHARPAPPADVAASVGSLQPADDLRLPVRARQDLRVPESRRQRALHLSAALRSARAGLAGAGSRDLPAGADRRAAPAAARALARRDGDVPLPDDDYMRELNEAYNHFFFHYNVVAAAGRRDLAARPLVGRRRGRRSGAADSSDGQGHALLRAANMTPALSFVIPLYNSAATIASLVRDIESLDDRGRARNRARQRRQRGRHERRLPRARRARRAMPITLVEHARNFGEHNAVLTGWRHARGAHIVNLDDDGQNPPAEAVKLVAARDGGTSSTSCSATTRSSSTRCGVTPAAGSPTA